MPGASRSRASEGFDHYLPGDVILAPLSFADLSGDKVRPAAIVSCDAYNISGDVIVAHITSNTATRRHISDYLLRDAAQAGLMQDSVVQGKLSTISIGLIKRKIGRLSARDLRSLSSVVLQETFYPLTG